jgi:hypothetical protein
MNLQEIERILNKYYNGESSLEEEAMLMDYFSRNEVPNGLKTIRDQFLYMQSQSKIELPEETERKINEKIESTRIISLFRTRRSRIIAISGVAATILLLITVFMQLNTYTRRFNDTYSDPEVAYTEARKILTFVSGQFNRGTREVGNISKFQTGLKDVSKVDKLNKQMENISRVQDLDDVKMLLTGNKQ